MVQAKFNTMICSRKWLVCVFFFLLLCSLRNIFDRKWRLNESHESEAARSSSKHAHPRWSHMLDFAESLVLSKYEAAKLSQMKASGGGRKHSAELELRWGGRWNDAKQWNLLLPPDQAAQSASAAAYHAAHHLAFQVDIHLFCLHQRRPIWEFLCSMDVCMKSME